MERDIKTGRAFLNEDDKRVFSEELAIEVFRTGQLTGIHHSSFPRSSRNISAASSVWTRSIILPRTFSRAAF